MTDKSDIESDAGTGSPNRPTAAERILRALADRGVSHVFANFGTDHTPILEAAARVRGAGDGNAIPEFVLCPTEFPAMSAAHGYAAVTGTPQAVVVHVDVGTQNLGAAMHNAHRANVPVFVLAGLAPVSHTGYPGSRDIEVHYVQDVFDQPGIVREYCRWMSEYRPPADPAELVGRGLQRATSPEPGPVYLSATREALEAPVSDDSDDWARQTVQTTGAAETVIGEIGSRLRSAERPLVITSHIGSPPAPAEGVHSLVSFAETVGAGVVENRATALNFPRGHELHAGFDPLDAAKSADLLIIAASDVPWVPSRGSIPDDVPVIQIDRDPSKRHYPQWPFGIDEAYAADPAETLSALADRVDPARSEAGRTHWADVHTEWREAAVRTVAEAREENRLTPGVVSKALDKYIDKHTILVDDAVTSVRSLLRQIRLNEPGSYVSKGGSGLGFGLGAAIGVKLARPESRVIGAVGDGAYLFGHPTVCAWMGAEYDAPTLTVVFDNQGWNAVQRSTRLQHPTGEAIAAGVPESQFGSSLDLSVPATAAGAVTRTATSPSELEDGLAECIDSVDEGVPAVLVAQVERHGK